VVELIGQRWTGAILIAAARVGSASTGRWWTGSPTGTWRCGCGSWRLGADLGVPAITAHRALTSGLRNSRLGPGSMAGQLVLVQGGAGAVGKVLLDIA
jgi:hypothetical protein